ncbi:MAG TPA: hypothetical protein VG895_01625 [Patescibacteria group bacterium]|nr:hypothetical protein [Patescibacteria group bacterium]
MVTKRVIAIAIFVLLFVVQGVDAGAIIATGPLPENGKLQVVWGLAPSEQSSDEWIGLFLQGTYPGNPVQHISVSGSSGVVYIDPPTNPGTYKFYLFSNGVMIQQGNTTTITGIPPTATPGNPNPQPATNGTMPRLAGAQQPNVPGGVNLSVVCYDANYRDGAVNIDNPADADGWRCKSGNTLGTLDWNLICHNVYGDDWHPERISNNIDGWRCAQGAVGQPPVIYVTPTPNQVNPVVSNNNCGALAPQLKAGQQAMVTQNGKSLNLRTGPGVSNDLIEVLQPGTIGVVVGGQYQCRDGYTWFELQFGNETGWVAESGSGYYWITNNLTTAQPTAVPQPPNPPVQNPLSNPSNPSGNSGNGGSGNSTDNGSGGNQNLPSTAAGGIDLYQYCKSLGYVDLKLVVDNIDGWKCVDSNGQFVGIDMDKACAWQYYGVPFDAALFTNSNDASTWKCYPNIPSGQEQSFQRVIQGFPNLQPDIAFRLVTDLSRAQNVLLCSDDFQELIGNASVVAGAVAHGDLSVQLLMPAGISDSCSGSFSDLMDIVGAEWPSIQSQLQNAINTIGGVIGDVG